MTSEPASVAAWPPIAAQPMFTLAHLSDPHVPGPLAAGPGALLGKRLLGYLSWRCRRTRIHRQEVLDALARDLGGERPDHVAVTGDLVNISLPTEFARAAAWLSGLGSPERVTVVPGNHDAYVAVPWARSWAQWAAYMSSETATDAAAAPPAAAEFPILRRRGPLAIVGLSTALPTAPGLASGRLGAHQLAALARLLEQLRGIAVFRVILLHHPPIPGTTPRRKGLADAAAFRDVVATAGAELVLFGHNHRFCAAEIAGADGPVPVFGVPSASALPTAGTEAGQYHLFGVERSPGGWTLALRARRYDSRSGRFVAADRRVVELVR
ncbi:MAG: metallophosphoesterase family protein [Rhodospirillales bacterium]